MPLINGIAAGSDQNVGLLRMGAQRYRAYLGETLVYGERDVDLPPGAGKILTDAANPIVVSEGRQTSFTVWLDRRPLSSVRLNVTLAEHPRDPITLITAARMRFTRGNWNTPQTVTIEANDALDVTDLYTSLTITGPEDQILNSVTRRVRIRNDDLLVPRLELDKTSLELGAGGDMDTFRARLTVFPSADVTVAFSELANASTSPTSLTFTPTFADMWQTVAVTSGADTGMETLTLTPNGGGVDGVAKTIDISVVNKAQVSISPDSLTLLEGETKEIQVRVVNAPENYVVVVRVDEASPLIYAGPQLLTFADARDQVVRVTALEDALVGDQNGAAQVRFILSGGGDNFTKVLPVAVVNIGSAPLVSASPAHLPIDAESTAAVAVKLTSRPYADVTVSATLPTRAGTLSASALTFTSDNWNTAQELTITAVALAAGANDVMAELKLVGSGGGVTDTATVSILVASTAAGQNSLILTGATVSIAAGTSDQVGVQLSDAPIMGFSLGQPTFGTVNVAIASDAAEVTVSPASVAFDENDWNTPKEITITADTNAAGETAVVTLTPSGAGSDGVAREIAVTVASKEQGKLPTFWYKTIRPVLEPGGPYVRGQYVLTEAPAAPVDVRVSVATSAELMEAGYTFSRNPITLQGDPVTLSFDENNYSDGLVLSTRADAQAAQRFGVLRYEVTKGQLRFNDYFIVLDIAAEGLNDVHPIFRATSISMTEGESLTVGVQLELRPNNPVTVLVTEQSPLLSIGGATLKFTPQNWNVAQDITLVARSSTSQTARTFNIYAYASGQGTSPDPAVLAVEVLPRRATGSITIKGLNVVYTSDRQGRRVSFLVWDRPVPSRLDEYYVASYAEYRNNMRGDTIETRETVNQQSIHITVFPGTPYIATVMRRGEPDTAGSFVFTPPPFPV